ncbi:hypothetical protein V6N12_019230 [Hibiscus sabdariffa]|uniref:Uncharacterized protein n=1 Tax=Hibiscus sabdariffa TaxID=183260 RepID=A0ABR2C6Y4_9ROSI
MNVCMDLIQEDQRPCCQGLKLSSVEVRKLTLFDCAKSLILRVPRSLSRGSKSVGEERREYELGDLSLARLKLGSSYAACLSSMKLLHLQLAPVSSTSADKHKSS